MNTCVVFFFVLVLGFIHCKLVNLTCKDIKKIVNGHNSRRLQLAKGTVPNQPAASMMNSVVWDEELAQMAAGWAKRGNFEHNPERTLDRFDVGENIYTYYTSAKNYELDVDSPLDAWFKEYKNYEFTPLTTSDFETTGDDQIGHYTQMAWADTTYVGCGVSRFREGRFIKYFVVCDYGPAGNYLGEVPYETGTSSGRLRCGADSCAQPYGPSC